jgi:phage FluMu protein Com
MPRTIKCRECHVLLNLPAQAVAGKKLKCPRCGYRFIITDAEASSASTLPGMVDATETQNFPSPRKPPSADDLPAPIAEGDLRETFDLPLVSAREAERSGSVREPDAADVAGLFAESGPSARRVTAAEARAKGRRCMRCGGLVPQGMSICSTCGTDQETGVRVGFDDDFAPPPPPPPQGPPLHISIIGTFCAAAAIILLVLAVINSVRQQPMLEYLCWICLALVSGFGIYSAVAFIRGKSVKLLMMALSLGVVVDLMNLIALPLINANFADQIVDLNAKPADIEDAPVTIKPLEERLDNRKIEAGIGLLLVYAFLSLYLMSPPVKRYISSRAAREPY